MAYSNILQQASQLQDELVGWRRHLHRNPETGMDLTETAAFVKAKLEGMGYQPEYMAGTGVTALAGGKKKGKCILIRADMDALPVLEQTSLEFKSVNGKMHACGHDFHTTMLLGAAKLLKTMEDDIEGTVKLMFQPGEETLQGAKAMVEGGILDNPHVDAAAMFHVGAGLPGMRSGVLIVPAGGVLSAASDLFEINIKGKGGHGAMPENSLDPLNAAAHIHIALQAIHSRELSASDSAVVTVGTMAGGSAHNVIPDTAVLKGSIRTFDEKVQQFIFERIRDIAVNTAKAFRTEAQVNIIVGCPSVVVDKNVADSIRSSLQEVFGQAVPNPDMIPMGRMSASEDFAFVSQKVPSLIMMIGVGSAEEGYQYPMHHPQAIFNEAVLSQGAAAYAVAALGWLHRNQ